MRRMNARTLEKEALELPPDKRAKLAQRLRLGRELAQDYVVVFEHQLV